MGAIRYRWAACVQRQTIRTPHCRCPLSGWSPFHCRLSCESCYGLQKLKSLFLEASITPLPLLFGLIFTIKSWWLRCDPDDQVSVQLLCIWRQYDFFPEMKNRRLRQNDDVGPKDLDLFSFILLPTRPSSNCTLQHYHFEIKLLASMRKV